MTPHEIQRARKKLGLTQKALAERLNVTVTTVARWEAGGNIHPLRLDAVRKALHLPAPTRT